MNRVLNTLWLVFALLMLIVGIASVVMPMETFLTLVALIPIVLIAGGVVGIFHYFSMREAIGSKWVLSDSLLSLLFGFIFAFGGIGFTSIMMIYFIVFLTILKGILGILSSLELKKRNFPQWLWLFIIAVINILIGIIFAINPSIASTTIGILIGIYFIFFGLISLMAWWGFKKLS